MTHFRPEVIDQAIKATDLIHSDSENQTRMIDAASQFTGPLSPEAQQNLLFDIDEESRRRRGMIAYDFNSQDHNS